MYRFASLANLVLAGSLVLATAFGLGASSLSCSDDESTALPGSGGAGVGGSGDAGTGLTDAGGTGGQHSGSYEDFPASPLVDGDLPATIAGLFDAAVGSDTGGPCLAEPALEAMVPTNWTPLFFEWIAPVEQNVFELRLEVDNQDNDLLVYTTKPSFTMSKEIWTLLALHSKGLDVTISLRGATLQGGEITAGPLLGAKGVIHIAPVEAPGSVVYWRATSGTSFEGFEIGDEETVTVLTPQSAGTTSTGGSTTCVSCHASSPDGELIIYTRDTSETRAIDVRKVDGTGGPDPSVITQTALNMLGRHKQSAPVLSAAHYEPGNALALSIFINPQLTANQSEIIWTDLEATSESGWGILPRQGDLRQATSPSWRRDGTAVAYVSSETAYEGVVAEGAMDIFTVPFNHKQGGPATALPGASDPVAREYYPVYSAEDTLLAFNRTDELVDSYDQPSAEVFVVPAEGGTARRLRANDPPTCTGLVSPGLTNSWPRWAPDAEQDGDKRFYWLVFSSKRRLAGQGPRPQLYVAAVVTTVTADGETIEQDYPALYVTSQEEDENNHTPAWENFAVHRVPN